MPSLQSLRRKIASVKNTQKITKAMKMVAAAKLKRAQDRILSARPYAHQLRDVVRHLAERASPVSHPLLRKHEGHKTELLVITSDRGLCGAFNANILRQATEFLREHAEQGEQVSVSASGRKGCDFFRRRTWTIRQEWQGIFDRLSFEHALDMGQDIIQHYNDGTFDQLYVVYNEFKSVMQQRVVIEKLLPIESLDEEAGGPGPERSEGTTKTVGAYLFEPDEHELLETLLPKHFQVQAFRVLLESAAAEQAARMTAMDGATRNAGELIQKVTLFYNKTRQAAITKELMDIVGGAEALK
ncbi:MAG: ATP synthase F1 subunit gamma [Nitrospira sp. SB0667_bin_9]|nr:ATP synthase F1 subunit gamma [Nitrospira sp. SB0667_bin_9]MYD32013.1 ATP synthase F1 subunit gamma [Nitrospira sp. SB0661_bin_20]MYJ22919.1 ATP synthase F1 subunit gamma [Nitrospira sp. SB0673_bin_12]